MVKEPGGRGAGGGGGQVGDPRAQAPPGSLLTLLQLQVHAHK